jgi:hypothetical protein
MAALFLVYVHNRTVPVTLFDTFKYAWLPSLTSGITAMLIVLPLRWMIPNSVIGLLIQVSSATFVLCLFGFIFLSKESEKNLVISVARRLFPRIS